MKRYKVTGERGGTSHERYQKGKGYWKQLKMHKDLIEQRYAYDGTQAEEMGLLTCPMCGKGFRRGEWYVYVVPTGECVHMGACICMYPKSIWMPGEKEELTVRNVSKEDEYLLNIAVDEVLIEGRDVEEVAEEFEINEEMLRKEIQRKGKEE